MMVDMHLYRECQGSLPRGAGDAVHRILLPHSSIELVVNSFLLHAFVCTELAQKLPGNVNCCAPPRITFVLFDKLANNIEYIGLLHLKGSRLVLRRDISHRVHYL